METGCGLSGLPVSSLPGTRKSVIAHSQGNVVVSSALRDFGMSVTNYVIMEGAIRFFIITD